MDAKILSQGSGHDTCKMAGAARFRVISVVDADDVLHSALPCLSPLAKHF
jgi:hypothetical protein